MLSGDRRRCRYLTERRTKREMRGESNGMKVRGGMVENSIPATQGASLLLEALKGLAASYQ
jgi:hypothetical protein